jgi:hypothetical protein
MAPRCALDSIGKPNKLGLPVPELVDDKSEVALASSERSGLT